MKQLPDHWIGLITAILILLGQFSFGVDIASLLMLIPWLVCCVPVMDSLRRQRRIWTWNKLRMRFDIVERDENPFCYWLNLVICWPASFVFAYALVMMPRR